MQKVLGATFLTHTVHVDGIVEDVVDRNGEERMG